MAILFNFESTDVERSGAEATFRTVRDKQATNNGAHGTAQRYPLLWRLPSPRRWWSFHSSICRACEVWEGGVSTAAKGRPWAATQHRGRGWLAPTS